MDTGQVLKQVRCPVLWFLADLVPRAQSEPRLRQALKEAGNGDVTIKVLPNASHMLLETRPELHGRGSGT